jgi:light-regulated signal transduction histidine kinase (bacteriophytochrome)
LGIIIFFLLIVGFLGAYILSLYITKRIDTLAQKVRQISQGNLDVSIQPLSNDEISGLVKDVENMRLSIKDLRENLEEKVKSRTTQLEETNKELEAFAYSVSHDIREPLRSIRGFSQALLEDYASSLDAGGVDYVKRIVLASQRSSDLINDILRLSRISRGDMYIDNVNLSEMSIPICEELRKKHPGKNINFSIAEGMIAKGDPRFLKLALENLFSNACKYSSQRKNPQIDFGAIMDDKKTTFFIRDNGSGFDMAQAYKLFMPFQRLHADDQFDGSGIGLATVQRIIHRHGGSIWAKSEPGTGSVFYFTLQ